MQIGVVVALTWCLVSFILGVFIGVVLNIGGCDDDDE